jgi:hypothetical protein
MKLAAVCTGIGFMLAAAAAAAVAAAGGGGAAVVVIIIVVAAAVVDIVGAVKMKLATVCTGDGFKLAAGTVGVAVIVGVVKMKLVVVCTGDGFKFVAAAAAVIVFAVVAVVIGNVVVTVFARKPNAGFVAGVLVGSFKPAPNPKFGGLLPDEHVPMDV